jgi:hypothetical protein
MNQCKGGESRVPNKMPQVGKVLNARITRVEQKTAAQVFTSKKAGKYEAKYTKPSDKVHVVHGKVDGSDEERKLGTVNAPRNPAGILYGTSRLYQLLVKAGFDALSAPTVSDDLHELRGRTVPVSVDQKDFVRLQFV